MLARALVALLVALPAFATSFVMVPDDQLVAGANAVVVGRVLSVANRSNDARPVTRYTVEVEELLQGRLGTRTIEVAVPGGVTKNGVGLRVHGAPKFASGDRAILFLVRNADGSFAPLHLMLGAFREQRDGDIRIAARDLADTREVSGAAPERRVRDFDKFRNWLRQPSGDRNYWIDRPRDRQTVTGQFTLFEEEGFHLRWFEFQWDRQVLWYLHQSEGTETDDRNVENVQRALAVWNGNEATLIDYRYVGRTHNTNGFSEFDEVNTVLFGDPNGEVSGSFRCFGGGVLAIGGSWFLTDIRVPYNGSEAIVNLAADVIVNDGIECLYDTRTHPDLEIEETLAHEIGHTLGFDHSCGDTGPCTPSLDEALMRAFIHGGAWGARLANDDRAAAAALYTKIGPRLGFSTTRPFPFAGEAVQFTLSRNLEGVTYAWDLGDGTTSTEATPRHTYAAPGEYVVRLRATDGSGTNEIVQVVRVFTAKRRATRH